MRNYADVATKRRKTFVMELGAPLKEVVLYFVKGKQFGQYSYVFHGPGNRSQSLAPLIYFFEILYIQLIFLFILRKI